MTMARGGFGRLRAFVHGGPATTIGARLARLLPSSNSARVMKSDAREALSRSRGWWRKLLNRGNALPESEARRHAESRARHAISLCHALYSERGEVSGARLARETIAAYQLLDAAGRATFFDLLVEEFSPDPETVGRAAQHYRDDPSQFNLIELQKAAEPARQELFRRLNMAPGGTAVLVDMRRQLLGGLHDNPQWSGIDVDFLHLLRSWFNRGFLGLQRIEWQAPASVLEKLMKYEAVHPIQGWSDLRRRLQADRRCYAFFHPALPNEPLIFMEVALTKGIATNVRPLLDPAVPVGDPDAADCALFYSITNCQLGLRGVSFGNFLIKQVAEELASELPRIRTFATLSPIPGFRPWLSTTVASSTPEEASLTALLERSDWADDATISDELRGQLVPLCAYYLLHARQGQEPLDPVARFHLANGAHLERLNWLADNSPTGLRQSCGLMANYVYRTGDIESNHEAFVRDHAIVASRRVQQLAARSLLAARKPPASSEVGEDKTITAEAAAS